MKKLGDILDNLFKKAGVDENNPTIIAMLQNEAIFKAEIDEAAADQIQGNLHTLDSAKSRIKKEVLAETYNGIDAKLVATMDELQVPDEVRTAILAERSTPERASLLVKKIKELEASKSSANTKGEKSELQAEINQLKALNAQVANDYKNQIEQLKQSHENEAIDWQLTSSLSGYNYALGDIDQSLKIQTAKSAISSAMQLDGVKVIKEGNQLKLVTAKDGTDYFNKQNNKVDLKQYVEQQLAQNKLIAVSNGQPAAPANTNGQIITKPNQSAGELAFMQKLSADLQAEMAQ